MSEEKLHWTEQTIEQIKKDHGDKKNYTIAAGISPSGTIHIGNFREIITQELIGRALEKQGKKVRFIYSWDDFDAFRKVPKDFPEQDLLKENLRKPLAKVPDVFGEAESYARRNQIPVEEDIKKVGIEAEFIYQNKMYSSCKYADDVKLALQNADHIRKILDKHRKDPLPESWMPIIIYDQNWKDDTEFVDYDGEYTVTYKSESGEHKLDLRKDGRYKLPWRVDWPMRWSYESVDFESAGKDHGTVGGSFDTGDALIAKVWGKIPPTHITYNFIRFKGGDGKMSSSSGGVIALGDVLKIYTPELTRFLFAGARPTAEFAISFDTEVLQVYDNFDKVERIYFGEEKVNAKDLKNSKIIYELSSPFPEKIAKNIPLQPGIRHLTTLVQIFPDKISRVKEYFDVKTKFDEERLMERAERALYWVQNFAPDDFKFSVNKDVKDLKLDKKESETLKLLAEKLDKKMSEDQIFKLFGSICDETGLDRKQFFKAAYKALISKEKGPKLATLIVEIGVNDVKKLLDKIG